jgi:hypothetical protein
MNRRIATLCAATAAALAASNVHAATLAWMGGSGTLVDGHYSDGTNTNLTPTSADVVDFGATGTGTYSTPGAISFSKLRVGHNDTTLPGAGTLTVSNGAQINLTGGAAGAANAGLWVGNVFTSTLTIDGATTSVTSNRLIIIGYAPGQPTRNGTVNVTNGGSLIAADGNINIGDSSSTSGMQGRLNVNGTVSVAGPGADLNIGLRGATSFLNQTGGTVTVNDDIEVGTTSGTVANTNSSYSISNAGTTSNGGDFFLGRGATVGAALNVSNTATLTIGTAAAGGSLLMGAGTATGVVVNHSGGTITTSLGLRVADDFTAAASDATYNLSQTGVLTTPSAIIGRQGVGKFIQTGGDANFNGTLSIGNRDTAILVSTSGLYKISAGDFDANALSIAPNGTGEFRVVGDDSTIDVVTTLTVGNTANGNGTLAFELESGDLLSEIMVGGAATFAGGTNLVFDATAAAPTQNVYDLLTATTITDGGIAFTGPAGWNYQIVSGGNGQILQAVLVPEPASLGLIALTGLAALRRRRRA